MKIARAAFFTSLAASCAALPFAMADVVSPRRASTIAVGPARGAMTMARVDPERRGATALPLPKGSLRVLFKKSISAVFDQPALVNSNGEILAVSSRGDLFTLTPEGEEKQRVIRGGLGVGPAALLSNGTLLFVTAHEEAIGIRDGAVVFEAHLSQSGTSAPRAAPLPLSEGGAVVATGSELIVIDSQGAIRARTKVGEPPALPLIRAPQEVISIASTGTVYAWPLRGESRRIGAFSTGVQGAAALLPPSTLLATLSGGGQIAAFDLATGLSSARAIPSSGSFVGPPTLAGDALFALGTSGSQLYAAEFNREGGEAGRTALTLLPMTDAGPQIQGQLGPLVDSNRTLVFASADGQIGSVSGGGVDTLGEKICSFEYRGSLAGLSPSPDGAFIALCRNGTIAKIGSLRPQ